MKKMSETLIAIFIVISMFLSCQTTNNAKAQYNQAYRFYFTDNNYVQAVNASERVLAIDSDYGT